ncbi:MAG: sugar phosphate isomerase/epimerase family protein [Emergencia sp.]
MGLIRLEQIAGMNCHYYNYSLDYFFDSMEKAGFRTVALWGGAPHFYLDYESCSDCSRIRKAARRRNLEIKCFTASSGTYGYQMGMQPQEQRKRVYRYYLEGIRAAAELGCSMMVMNSGWGYWNEDRQTAWERSKEMILNLCDAAEKEGVTLTMESLRRAETQLCWNLAETKKMYDEVAHPALKIMIDTTAMGVAGETPEQWFEVFGSDIINTHFIDGNPYGHLVWGDGTQPLGSWLETLRQYDYQGILGLEITARRYYQDPAAADMQNMKILSEFL